MSMGDRLKSPSSNTCATLDNVSQIRAYTVISTSRTSDSLEDGEIVDGHPSGITSQPLSQQPKDEPQSRLPSQDGASLPPLPTTKLVASCTPTIEPMTEEDLDRAKSIVLDLLGWGVTPEYLVACGLSSGAIYKIFTDLRLRLPGNLEVLLPHPPTPRSGPHRSSRFG